MNDNIIGQNTAFVNTEAIFISEGGETVARDLRQIQKHLSEEDVAQIVLTYQSGASANQLANQYGYHRHTICAQLKKEWHRSNLKQNPV